MSSYNDLDNKYDLIRQLQDETIKISNEINKLNASLNCNKAAIDVNNNNLNNISDDGLNICDLVESDFLLQNKDFIQKKADLKKKKEFINSLLPSNTKKKKQFHTLTDAYKCIEQEVTQIKTITVNENNTNSTTINNEQLTKLNNLIDKEYEFNLKLLKSYCIFCHFRGVKMPTKNMLNDIKEDLEGLKFLEFNQFNIKYPELNDKLYYITVDRDNLQIKFGYGYFKKYHGSYILITNSKGISKNTKVEYIKLNSLNPIFRKINFNDI